MSAGVVVDSKVEIPKSGLLERSEELKSLDDWADNDRITPTRVILGGPGVGKSAIVRMWIDSRQTDERGERLIYHMIQQGQDPATIVQSLIEQCDHLVPDPEASTAIDRPRLLHVLQRVAAECRRLIVVLDALDETSDLGRLRELIASPLPPGVRLLCSSRPQSTPNAGLGDPPAVSSLDLDQPRWKASNEATCRKFWERRKAEVDWLTQQRIDEALRFGQGNMLYAVQLWSLLSSLPGDERGRETTPPSLDAVIERTWRRIDDLHAESQPILDALGVLTLAREPLWLAQIAELADWPADYAALRDSFLACVRPILRGDVEISLYHGALADGIRRRIPDLDRIHGAMIPRLHKWLERDQRRSRDYAVRHILDHCAQTGSWTAAIDLCLNQPFVERWLAGGDPVAATQLLDRLASEAAEDRCRIHLTRLANIVREYPDSWQEEMRPLWLVRPPPPKPRIERLMVVATASPYHLDRVRSDEEMRMIKSAWARQPGLVRLDFCPAARIGDVQKALLAEPTLLHVGCHKVQNGPLEFEVDEGTAHRPGAKNLVRLLSAIGGSLELIVLNTCHSAELARQLSEGRGLVPVAIGMDGAIPDDSALEFINVFYEQLALNFEIEEAFEESVEQMDEEDRGYPQLFAARPEAKRLRLFPANRGASAG